MSKLIWHPDALQDLARHYDFWCASDPKLARRSVALIRTAADKICANPEMGKPRAEFREWIVKFGKGAYVLRYLIFPTEDVLMVRIWHGRENRP